jgi:hypothetical protein
VQAVSSLRTVLTGIYRYWAEKVQNGGGKFFIFKRYILEEDRTVIFSAIENNSIRYS